MNYVCYCNNCFIVNNSIDKDNTGRSFKENYNDDCVTVFGNNAGNDDVQSVANTLKSLGDNTFFQKLPDYNIVDDFVIKAPEILECIPILPPIECNVIDGVSVESNISKDFSEIIPVNENIKQYLMKGGTCGIRSCNSKTFDFGHTFYQLDKLELMIEK